MEQHPIPQQISSYQFKLVGDMTLKQFFQVAGGALVGLLFYSTNLHFLIKWPIILISTLIGIALAFLPFEERPLEKWIIAFFRSIYSPTLYVWKKAAKLENFYTESSTATTPTINTTTIPPDYLNSTPQTSAEEHKKLESAEKSFLSKITSMWGVGGQPPASNSNAPITQTVNKQAQATPPVTVPIAVPAQIPTVIPRTGPKLIVEERPSAPQMGTNVQAQSLGETTQMAKTITTKEAEFSIDAAPPNPPTVPNTVVGQVIDNERKIISGAIMEIRDSAGRPVRALRSNLVGHFIIVTPLLNGKYEINTEKDGYKFDPISFNAEGSIIPPIAIRGTKV